MAQIQGYCLVAINHFMSCETLIFCYKMLTFAAEKSAKSSR
ncbi:hypothetical protein H1P_2290003 [Hyella patelloides LEGE 07179]|uniref:Uncharacterized protein n=1 Tax=Hyella patelloides LEGE 07179 TaxID=945734 RepID=A0A563VR76_9CYAN|nr:hypothetical protein H1P_2290003 [Hyella patelloides LEGE 07179]